MFSMPQTAQAGEPPTPCTGLPTDLFFPKADGARVDRPTPAERLALNVCATCPLAARRQCLAEALKYPGYKQHGVQGGTTAIQRKALILLRRKQLAEVA